MSWKKLTSEDLKLVLAQDEINKLEECSVDIDDVLQKQLDIVADLFRGAWKSKGYTIDIRDNYIAPEYIVPILNYARWQIWTRFPATETISLSENRKVGYEEAVELLKNPYIGVSKPDYSDDPELSGNTELNKIQDSAISMPYLRMDDPYIGFSYNFQGKFKTI